ARTLHEAGYTKRSVQERLWEWARFPKRYFSARLVRAAHESGCADADSVWRAATPDQIHLAVAGAGGLVADGLRPQDGYIPARSRGTGAAAPAPAPPRVWV